MYNKIYDNNHQRKETVSLHDYFAIFDSLNVRTAFRSNP